MTASISYVVKSMIFNHTNIGITYLDNIADYDDLVDIDLMECDDKSFITTHDSLGCSTSMRCFDCSSHKVLSGITRTKFSTKLNEYFNKGFSYSGDFDPLVFDTDEFETSIDDDVIKYKDWSGVVSLVEVIDEDTHQQTMMIEGRASNKKDNFTVICTDWY